MIMKLFLVHYKKHTYLKNKSCLGLGAWQKLLGVPVQETALILQHSRVLTKPGNAITTCSR